MLILQKSSKQKEGFIPEDSESKNDHDNPFEEIGTRPPPTSSGSSHKGRKRIRIKNAREYYENLNREHQQHQSYSQNALTYRVYPGLHPKDQTYCPNMRGMFAYTCQPSKPLRLDLVEFCKDYSAFCRVPNFHRLPGPRMGPPQGDKSNGHVGVNGKFGFGIGSVPGLEVGVGWGVDVGPIPGMGESVGVDLGLDLGIMGAKTPEAFRRG
ncbi:unnamed protein product [Cylicocyclus nassatus]|uniref:Uncharacterized protein n=1 Tax=Cylicocyclus nassatus TaxID=53992 RepID=A0AA36MF65_CYLNA|nr:unnamed protein product [Cylicocyclus nassatus]